MKNVIWRDIKGYEGIYQVSNYGEVIRLMSYDSRGHLRKSKILKQNRNKYGYLQLGLHKNGKEKKFLVHRLVAETFIPNEKKYPEINHKDENKQNNSVSNLEWCNRIYNVNYGNAQIKRIKTRFKERKELNYA